jgi:hypothetical protein
MISKPRLLIVGIGPHARNFYLSAFRELEVAGVLAIAGLVDIEPQRQELEKWLDARGHVWPRLYLPAFSGPIPDECRSVLETFAAKNRADGIVISTDPLNHKNYALWALERRLSILMDKPVTAAVNAVTDPAAAEALETDYQEIADARQRWHPGGVFILCAHRRYHPGMEFALQLVRQAAALTGCPVTNIHGYHSDGQWRLPEEILHQDHHSYHHGHGKISHSGFHFIDTLYRFRRAGRVNGKTADHVEICSTFLQPNGFLLQIAREDYRRLFGPGYDPEAPTGDAELAAAFPGFGEIDVEASFSFTREGTPLGLGSLSLLHGGFSRRSWLKPGTDLYKGNGRVKHEQHRVHVGPFLGLQIHSCQAKDNHERSGPDDELPGGNNHFELWIFRNADVIGGEPFEKVEFKDLPEAAGYRDDKLFIEQVKRGAIQEFVAAITGRLDSSVLRSDFADHHMPVRLMSGLYRSHILRRSAGNPLLTLPWKE